MLITSEELVLFLTIVINKMLKRGESMELKFYKQQICEVLEKYYREEEDFIGKVSICATTGWVGYGLSEEIGCILDMKIAGELDIMGQRIPGTINITTKEVENAFHYYFGKEGYSVSNIQFNSGIRESCEGYGMAEHTVKKPYFDDITVTVKNKEKKIGGILYEN